MSTKAELIAILNTKFAYVKDLQYIFSEEWGSKTKAVYQTVVSRVSGDLATFFYFCIYVFDEGLPTEVAYFETSQVPDELKTV